MAANYDVWADTVYNEIHNFFNSHLGWSILNELFTVATHDKARSSPHQRKIKAQGAEMEHSKKTMLQQELPGLYDVVWPPYFHKCCL